MSTDTLSLVRPPDAAFRHEALLYSGRDGFMDGCLEFLRGAVAAAEPALVVVSAAKIRLLREALGVDASAVLFADMDTVGANPACIIPAWRRFVDDHVGGGRPLRGIDEPIWAERSAEQLVECQRHEDLLNVAFAGSPAWWLLCPYDVTALPVDVIDEARRSHPFFVRDGHPSVSTDYRGLDAEATPFDAPLPEPGVVSVQIPFDADTLADVRAVVEYHAAECLPVERVDEMVFAVNEIASNSLRYGGGCGLLRVWIRPDDFVCEVRDRGFIREPLVGRELPPTDITGGRGVWLANHLCDLVQIRSSTVGTVVRLHAFR